MTDTRTIPTLAKKAVEVAEFATKVVENPITKQVEKIIQPIGTTLKALEVVQDYKEIRGNGGSVLAAVAGAGAGATTRRVMEGMAAAEATIAVEAAATGIGAPVAVAAAGAAYATWEQKGAAGHAASHAVAKGVTAVEERVAASDMYYPVGGVDEPGVLLPKSMSKLTAPASSSATKPKESSKEVSGEVTGIAAAHGQSPSVSMTNNTSSASAKPGEKKPVRLKQASRPSGHKREDKSGPSTLTAEDQKTAEFLIAYGSTPNDVVKIYQDPSAWNLAKDAVKQCEKHQKNIETLPTQANCIEFFKGMNSIFTAFSQCSNPSLNKVGAVGGQLMMGAIHLETLTGVFSGGAGSLATVGFAGSFAAIGGLIGVGICLVSMLLGSDDDEQQRQLMEAIQKIHQHIDTVRREMHERFDHLESAIHQIGSLCNIIIQNQKALFEQNKHHIELSIQGFRSISALLGDFRAESKRDHEKIFKQFSYLIGLKEKEPLQNLKEAINDKAAIITETSKSVLSEAGRFELAKQLTSLGEDLKRCASSYYNGSMQFTLAKGDPEQSANFLYQRRLDHDDALGFLAEEIESIDEKPLIQAGIKKDKLPATALWASTIAQYITLSRLPIFAANKSATMASEIKEQSENLAKFLKYIKTSGVIEKLLARHKKYLDDFQQALYQAFTHQQRTKPDTAIKDKKEDEARARKLTVGEYCSSGATKATVEETLSQIDYNYLLLNRLVYLAGYPQAFQQEISQLDRSTTLCKQTYNFNETAVSDYASNLLDESYVAQCKGYHDTPYHNSHIETIGAHLYGTSGRQQLLFTQSMCYPEDQPGAASSCGLGIGSYDLSTRSISNIASLNSNGNPPIPPFPLVKYKGNFKETINHTWASSHIVNGQFVWYTGGSGYVVLFDLKTGKSELVDTSKLIDEDKTNALTFTVPVVKLNDFERRPGDNGPDTTCYTHKINDRYLHITKLRWQTDEYDLAVMSGRALKRNVIEIKCETEGLKYRVLGLDKKENTGMIPWAELPDVVKNDQQIVNHKWRLLPSILDWTYQKDHTSSSYPAVDRQVIDLEQKRPLASYEIHQIFNNWDCSTKLACPAKDMPITPNQFFINTIRPVGKNEAMVYGFVQSNHTFKKILRLENEKQLENNPLDSETIAVILTDSNGYKELKVFWKNGDKLEKKAHHASNVLDIIKKLPDIHEVGSDTGLFFSTDLKPKFAAQLVAKFKIPCSQISASFYYKNIIEKGAEPIKFSEMKNPGFGIRHFPIAVKTIHQTHSEVLHVEGENKLYIPMTITDENEHDKLVILSADFFNNPKASLIETQTFDIPKLHPVSDCQAMRTAVAKIGGKEYLIIAVLNADSKMLIYSYDPKLNKLTQLMDGPQLKFVDYTKNTNPQYPINYRIGVDPQLSRRRKSYPGFYPLRSLEIRVSEVNGLSTLHIAYPTIDYPSQTQYQIRVASMPLAPALAFKPLASMPAQSRPSETKSPAPAAELPANHLGAAIGQARILLALPERTQPAPAHEAKDELRSESTNETVLQSLIQSCKSIHELFSDSITELKLTQQKVDSIKGKLDLMESKLTKLEDSDHENDEILLQIKAINKLIYTIDGLLKSKPKYVSGVGKNINKLIKELNSEIDTMDKSGSKEYPPPTPLRMGSLFSATNREEVKSATNPISPKSPGEVRNCVLLG